MTQPPHLPTNLDGISDKEKIAYCDWWISRGKKVSEIMDWAGLFSFDPHFRFSRKDNSVVTLDIDVVERLIYLYDSLSKWFPTRTIT